jgi:hypothetical protein
MKSPHDAYSHSKLCVLAPLREKPIYRPTAISKGNPRIKFPKRAPLWRWLTWLLRFLD